MSQRHTQTFSKAKPQTATATLSTNTNTHNVASSPGAAAVKVKPGAKPTLSISNIKSTGREPKSKLSTVTGVAIKSTSHAFRGSIPSQFRQVTKDKESQPTTSIVRASDTMGQSSLGSATARSTKNEPKLMVEAQIVEGRYEAASKVGHVRQMVEQMEKGKTDMDTNSSGVGIEASNGDRRKCVEILEEEFGIKVHSDSFHVSAVAEDVDLCRATAVMAATQRSA